LLVGLTNELFDQVQKMNPTKEESKIEEMSTSKKTSKIEFTDISWYKKLLDANKEKELTREQKNLDNSPK